MKLDNHLMPGAVDDTDARAPFYRPSFYRPRVMRQFSCHRQEGKIGWIFLWLIGVPVPLLLVFFLLRGCT